MPLYGAPGERISYAVYPSAQPGAPVIVLVHGFTASSVSFDANLAGLREHFTVITTDLLGHGDSDAPADVAPYRAEAAVARLIALFDELELEDVLLCGHSLGAALCLRLALDQPGRLAGLIVINSSSAAGTPEWREQAQRGMSELAARVRTEGAAFLRQTRLYPAHSKRLDAHSRELLVESFDRLTPEGIAGTAEGLVAGVNAYERLGDLRVPTLVVLGERDADFMRHAPGFLSRLPAYLLRTARLEGAGHAANIEQPAAFEHAVVTFADELGLFEVDEAIDIEPGAAPGEEPAKRGRNLGGAALTAVGAVLVAGGIGLLAAAFLSTSSNNPQQLAAAPPPSPTATATAVTAIAGTRSAGPNAALTAAALATTAGSQTTAAAVPPTVAPSSTPTATATSTRPAATPTRTPTPEPTETPAPTPTPLPPAPTIVSGPAAAISGPDSVEVGDSATFIDGSTPADAVLGWQWSTSGEVVSQLNPAVLVVRFPAPGCYTVSVTARFPDGNRSTTITVAAGDATCP